MMKFEHSTILVREFGNGVLVVAAVQVFFVLAYLILHECKKTRRWWRCWKDEAVQVLFAFMLLTLGHAVFRFFSWLTFIAAHSGVDSVFVNSVSWFLVGAGLVLVAKLFVVWVFLLSWKLVALILGVAFAVPTLVLLLNELGG